MTTDERIEVFFQQENGSYNVTVAVFYNDELYTACAPTLEAEAKKLGMLLGERVLTE